MTEVERKFIEAAGQLTRWSDAVLQNMLTRKIFITPFEGYYGPFGVVVTIEGSPPKGIYVAETAEDGKIWVLGIEGKGSFIWLRPTAKQAHFREALWDLMEERGLGERPKVYQK